MAHAAAEVGVDGEDQRLDEETAIEGHSLGVNLLRVVVGRGLSRNRVACVQKRDT